MSFEWDIVGSFVKNINKRLSFQYAIEKAYLLPYAINLHEQLTAGQISFPFAQFFIKDVEQKDFGRGVQGWIEMNLSCAIQTFELPNLMKDKSSIGKNKTIENNTGIQVNSLIYNIRQALNSYAFGQNSKEFTLYDVSSFTNNFDTKFNGNFIISSEIDFTIRYYEQVKPFPDIQEEIKNVIVKEIVNNKEI